MTVDDSVVQKLWKLTNELTAQLVFNRNATLELKQQLADLQAKTSQAPGSVSIAQDVGLHGTSSQEHADLSLRIANERLQDENSQLQEQLREYERWMEYIMTKFRLQNFAMAQSRKEAMHEAYRMAEHEGEVAVRLQEENAILQARLSDVGTVARRAINEEYYNTESIIETLEIENQGLREMLGVANENFNPMAVRQPGNRVSFPSTGSYVASSGSDREQQHHGRGVGAPMSPSDQAPTKASGTISSTSTTSPAPSAIAAATAGTRARKAPGPEPSSSTAGKSVSSSASNSTVTSPILKATQKFSAEPETIEPMEPARKPTSTRKKPDETVPSTMGTGTKSGMIINTSVVPKRNSSVASNSSNSHGHNTPNASVSSSSTKPKKTNRKQKA